MKWGVCCPYWGWALPHKAPPSGHKRPLATHMRGAVLAFPDQDRSHTCSVRDRPPQLCIDRKAGRHSPQPREWLRPVCPPLFPTCYGAPGPKCGRVFKPHARFSRFMGRLAKIFDPNLRVYSLLEDEPRLRYIAPRYCSTALSHFFLPALPDSNSLLRSRSCSIRPSSVRSVP